MKVEDVDRMVELYNEKTPLIRIANMFGTTAHQVKRSYNNEAFGIMIEKETSLSNR